MAPTAASASVTATASAADAERRGDGGLVAGPHREQRGHRAEQTGDLVGRGQQRAGAVLAVEADLEGLLAGGQGGALALGALRLVAGLRQPLLDVVEQRRRALVLGVEPLLAGVEAGDPGLERGEVALGALGAGHGLLAGVARAGRSRRRRRRRGCAAR